MTVLRDCENVTYGHLNVIQNLVSMVPDIDQNEEQILALEKVLLDER
jgi:hypothetical protein